MTSGLVHPLSAAIDPIPGSGSDVEAWETAAFPQPCANADCLTSSLTRDSCSQSHESHGVMRFQPLSLSARATMASTYSDLWTLFITRWSYVRLTSERTLAGMSGDVMRSTLMAVSQPPRRWPILWIPTSKVFGLSDNREMATATKGPSRVMHHPGESNSETRCDHVQVPFIAASACRS